LKTNHNLDADPEYISRCQAGVYLDNDAVPELFAQPKPLYQDPEGEHAQILPGMKLEAIDPLNLSAICVATVMRVIINFSLWNCKVTFIFSRFLMMVIS